MKFEAPPGTHDVLAKDWPHWQRILREVSDTVGARPAGGRIARNTAWNLAGQMSAVPIGEGASIIEGSLRASSAASVAVCRRCASSAK